MCVVFKTMTSTKVDTWTVIICVILSRKGYYFPFYQDEVVTSPEDKNSLT